MNWLYSVLVFAQSPAGDPVGGGGGGAPATGPGQPPPCGGQGMMFQLVMIGAIFAIFYFLLIRPQQKRAREHQEMLQALRKGDMVYTQGGMYGKVAGMTDNTVTLEIAKVDNKHEVRVRVLRSAVAGKSTPTTEGGEAKDAEVVRQSQKG